jgi:hypothetical protein
MHTVNLTLPNPITSNKDVLALICRTWLENSGYANVVISAHDLDYLATLEWNPGQSLVRTTSGPGYSIYADVDGLPDDVMSYGDDCLWVTAKNPNLLRSRGIHHINYLTFASHIAPTEYRDWFERVESSAHENRGALLDAVLAAKSIEDLDRLQEKFR